MQLQLDKALIFANQSFKTKEEIPPELERLKPFYRNLDSLYQRMCLACQNLEYIKIFCI